MRAPRSEELKRVFDRVDDAKRTVDVIDAVVKATIRGEIHDSFLASLEPMLEKRIDEHPWHDNYASNGSATFICESPRIEYPSYSETIVWFRVAPLPGLLRTSQVRAYERYARALVISLFEGEQNISMTIECSLNTKTTTIEYANW